MREKVITVTEAARNFADCVNRAHYEGITFQLVKNGVAMATIEPKHEKPRTGKAQAEALREALKGFRLGKEEADVWLRELQEARSALPPVKDKWQS